MPKNNLKIKVKNSGLVKMQFFNDFPDGNLVIGEANKNVPFAIKRVYFINNLLNKKSVRGKHAHKKLEQVIFCVNGKFTLSLDDGKNRQKITLDSPYFGVRLGPRLWHTMSSFSSDCVILVLADNYYKESDYIRDYGKFLKYVRQ
ncbi:MAG: FdtA/QdtA family cupin domain-containing protein [Patescibacteria group bacterium]|nr:FdtA/QdtA family cupin domain-containing protein [Patescibacteria group bacterium]